MLEGILDGEGAENGHDDEKVVHRQRLFQKIARQEELYLLGPEAIADVPRENEGEGDPDAGPQGGVTGGNGLVRLVRVQVEPEGDDHEDAEKDDLGHGVFNDHRNLRRRPGRKEDSRTWACFYSCVGLVAGEKQKDPPATQCREGLTHQVEA